MRVDDCPPGYIRTALGNCIEDPKGKETWELVQPPPVEHEARPVE